MIDLTQRFSSINGDPICDPNSGVETLKDLLRTVFYQGPRQGTETEKAACYGAWKKIRAAGDTVELTNNEIEVAKKAIADLIPSAVLSIEATNFLDTSSASTAPAAS